MRAVNARPVAETGTRTSTRAAESPLTVRAGQAAQLVGVGLATWWRWDAAGKVPAGLKDGDVRFWRRAELLAWIEAG